MTRDKCVELIIEVYRQYLPAGGLAGHVGAETRLFGGDSPLDSTALASMVIEMEQQVNDLCDRSIVIADDRAMAQKGSPFRTIGALADYIQLLLSEQRRA